jgi:hypothetical protein
MTTTWQEKVAYVVGKGLSWRRMTLIKGIGGKLIGIHQLDMKFIIHDSSRCKKVI